MFYFFLQGGDAFSTAKIVTCIVELLWEARDFKGLIANLQLLAKKRGQLKQVSSLLSVFMICLIGVFLGGHLHGPKGCHIR